VELLEVVVVTGIAKTSWDGSCSKAEGKSTLCHQMGIQQKFETRVEVEHASALASD